MIRLLVAAVGFCGVVSPAAFACECPALKNPEAKARFAEKIRNEIATVRVTRFQMAATSGDDPEAEATAQVVSQPVAGPELPTRITIFGLGGDESANCGTASWLFSSVSNSKDMRVVLIRGHDATYTIDACNSTP